MYINLASVNEKTYKISKTTQNLVSNGDEVLLDALESFLETYKETANNNNYPKIPISVFASKRLGVLEALVKYLREKCGLHYSDIAQLIERDQRTVWASYNNAKKKNAGR